MSGELRQQYELLLFPLFFLASGLLLVALPISYRLRQVEPQRNMRWLHSLLNHHQQLPAQLIEVHLISECSAESGQRLLGVMLFPVEAPVDDLLNAVAQRVEEGGNRQRREDNTHWLSVLASEEPNQALQSDGEARVECSQNARKQAIDQRAVDNAIDTHRR